jgi:ribosomal 50S subunit-associated protein YjgA (DUF615 family)
MSLETISRKQLNDLEQQVGQLLVTIRRAKLENIPLIEALQKLEQELEQSRHERFDAANSEYQSY